LVASPAGGVDFSQPIKSSAGTAAIRKKESERPVTVIYL